MIATEISFQLITCCSGPAQEHTQKQGTVLWFLHSGQTALLQLSHITWRTLAQKVFFLQETITLDTGTVVAVKWWINLWVYYKPQEITCFIIKKKNHPYPFIRLTFGKCRRDFISSHSYKVHDQKGLKLWKQAEQLGRLCYPALFITPMTEGDLHMTMPLSWAKKHYLQKPSLWKYKCC